MTKPEESYIVFYRIPLVILSEQVTERLKTSKETNSQKKEAMFVVAKVTMVKVKVGLIKLAMIKIKAVKMIVEISIPAQ